MFIGLELLHTWLASSNTISYPLVLTKTILYLIFFKMQYFYYFWKCFIFLIIFKAFLKILYFYFFGNLYFFIFLNTISHFFYFWKLFYIYIFWKPFLLIFGKHSIFFLEIWKFFIYLFYLHKFTWNKTLFSDLLRKQRTKYNKLDANNNIML